MPTIVLPDNTALINFTLINRMDLLQKLVRDNGAWCATVAEECRRSSRQPGLEPMMTNARAIFGEPLRPGNPSEHVMTRTFRTRLAKPGDEPHSHLGEAETLAIISCRSMRAVFVTDDTAVPVIASEQKIPVATTFELLRVAHRGGMVDADTLWSHIQTLRRERRAPAHLRDRAAFDTWLSS